MDSDRDFAQIKKLWRKTERIYIADEYHSQKCQAEKSLQSY